LMGITGSSLHPQNQFERGRLRGVGAPPRRHQQPKWPSRRYLLRVTASGHGGGR
jgi:hypothetical protein